MASEPLLEINGKIYRITDRINRKPLRKTYMVRFVIRCIIYVISLILYIVRPAQLEPAIDTDWLAPFRSITFVHIVWVIWVIDMVMQLIPLQKHIPIGSQKNFKIHFRPILEKLKDKEVIIRHIKLLTARAYKVFVLWAALIAAIGLAYHFELLKPLHLYLFAVTFYVCDLICVLFWCPFRVFIMKNKCCTTCRIFNWDHLMMFSPMLFLRSIFAWSLILLAIIVWAIWEITAIMYPERFIMHTNSRLKCSECTDRLCRKPRGDKIEPAMK